MLKKIVVGLLACCVLFLSFSCDSDSDENSVQYSQDFVINVFARNEQIFVSWGTVQTSDGYKNFKKVKIECKNEDKIVSTKEIENPGNTFYAILSDLENNKKYSVIFTGEAENKAYKKVVEAVLKKLESNSTNKIALYQDGKTYINFTLPEFLNGASGKTDFTNVNVYKTGGEKLYDSEYEWNLVPFYEVISEDVTEDSTKTYQKYYSVVVDGEYSSLDLRLLNAENVETESFTVEPKNATLPIINIEFDTSDSAMEKLKNKKKVDSTLSVKNYSGTQIVNAPLTVKGRGNSSWTNAPKKSYTLKFESKQSFLGFEKNKSFALVANYFDKTLLRNITAYELAKNVFTNMMWTPGVKPVNLFVNGIYSGIYNATETIKINSKRIDVPDISDRSDVSDFENYGYILEIDERMEENLCWKSEKGVPFNLKEPDGEDLQEEIKNLIKEKVASVEAMLFSDDFNDSSSENYYENYLDSDSFVDWWLLEELAKNTDSNFFSSCYMVFNPEDKKFYMGPVWDFDLGFGNTNDYPLEISYTDFKADETKEGLESWILHLLQDSAFKEKAKKRWTELKPKIEEYFNADKTADFGYEANYSSLQQDAELNFTRWPILGNATWKSPNGYEERTTYKSEKEFFINWKNKRIQWLDENL